MQMNLYVASEKESELKFMGKKFLIFLVRKKLKNI